jgi:serine/threonine-protein kinase
MKQITFITIAIFIATFSAFGQSKQKNTQHNALKGWKTFEQRDFIVQYPDTFELNTSGQMGFSFMILSPQTSPDDMFRENISLMIQDLKGLNISLDDYVELSKNKLEMLITDGKIIESKRKKTDDFEFHFIIYTGKHGIFDLKWMQHYIIKNEKIYVLTFTAEIDQFDNYIEVATKIMDSFKIK